MAIDTKEKRFSMLGFGNPSILHVIPQGAIGKSGRATLMHLYSGIPLEELDIVKIQENWDYLTENGDTIQATFDTDTIKVKMD